MILHIVICLAGFLGLYKGAEWLVKGSSSLARSLGVPPIIIGLTVVAFGTSAPELVVSVDLSIKAQSMMAVGNVIGSNILNIALVLGVAAVFQPIRCDRSVIRRDIPLMLAISVYLLVLCLDSRLSRFEGATLFAGIIAYTLFNYRLARRAARAPEAGPPPAPLAELEGIGHISSRLRQVGLILIGIAGVVGGAELVVTSAVEIMRALGVGEKFVGLTIVAFGTSLPELATSVVAAVRKEMDISLGNLVGSNVFNILSVLGAASLVRPIVIPGGFIDSGMVVDYGVMILTSLLPWLLMCRGLTLTRTAGTLLLSTYVVYLIYLVATA